MIISISGKAGSGKDTVGSIIQYLTTATYHKQISYDEWVNKWNSDVGNSTWKIKKYSDKLKDMVCLLLGCTREQLEDQEFKSSLLGEEYCHYGINKFFTGNIKSFNEHLEKEKYLIKASVNNYSPVRVGNEWIYSYQVSKEYMSVRDLLQRLGTEVIRNIHPDIWVNTLFADYVPDCPIEKYGADGHLECGCDLGPNKPNDGCEKPFPNWIITDSRFPNDVRRTREMGGVLIRVNRAECEGRKNEHVSETALDDFDEWDHVIDNNGTIEELIEQVRTILEKEEIIKEKE